MCTFISNSIEFIQEFFSTVTWTIIGNIFTILGAFSFIFTIVRYCHNSKQKEWHDNVSINDHDHNYNIEYNEKNPIYSKLWDEQSPYAKIIIFKPTNCIISKLEIMQLNQENLKVEKTIEIIKSISPETPVCMKVERAECIPMYRLRWYSDYGEFYNYDLIENRRNGMNDIIGVTHKKNFISFIRKMLGWK